jgi:hypothetical protein
MNEAFGRIPLKLASAIARVPVSSLSGPSMLLATMLEALGVVMPIPYRWEVLGAILFGPIALWVVCFAIAGSVDAD